jgi:aerobic C4-dicarboxylate transport protein
VYVVVILGLISKACGLNVFTLMRYFKTELLIALSTCSSEAILPQLVRKLEHLGVQRSVVGLVIPAGFSFNLDGSAVYLTMASLFLAQAVGIDLTWQEQLIMVGVMMLTSKGTAGIAGGAFIVLASTITAVGHVPLAALALIVGIDRLLNEGRVFINVLGNALGAIVIGKWENGFDAERAHQVLAGAIPLDIEGEYNEDVKGPVALEKPQALDEPGSQTRANAHASSWSPTQWSSAARTGWPPVTGRRPAAAFRFGAKPAPSDPPTTCTPVTRWTSCFAAAFTRSAITRRPVDTWTRQSLT